MHKIIDVGLSPNSLGLLLPPRALKSEIQINVSYENFLGVSGITEIILKTTNLPIPLPDGSPENPSLFFTRQEWIIDLEVMLPSCEGVADLSAFLGYSVDTLLYNWNPVLGPVLSGENFFKLRKLTKFLFFPAFSLKPLETYIKG